jgi:hypothetical protein
LLGNDPYTRRRGTRHVRCDVTQYKRYCKRRSLWVRAALFATQLCGKHISAAANQHATIGEAVFSVGPPRSYMYNEDHTQLELELSRVPELADGRIMARKEDFMCDLNLQSDCYQSVARKRLVESVIDCGHYCLYQ